MPIFFGDKAYHKFQEATDLVRLKGAFSVASTEDMLLIFNDLQENKGKKNQAALTCRNYVLENIGATEKVMHVVDSIL